MKLIKLWLLCFLLTLSSNSFAIYCGQYVIDIGDRKDQVLEKCGDPESTQTRTKLIGTTIQDPSRVLGFQSYEQIVIDEWIYNFGPNRFKEQLRFENNILRDINALERGH